MTSTAAKRPAAAAVHCPQGLAADDLPIKRVCSATHTQPCDSAVSSVTTWGPGSAPAAEVPLWRTLSSSSAGAAPPAPPRPLDASGAPGGGAGRGYAQPQYSGHPGRILSHTESTNSTLSASAAAAAVAAMAQQVQQQQQAQGQGQGQGPNHQQPPPGWPLAPPAPHGAGEPPVSRHPSGSAPAGRAPGAALLQSHGSRQLPPAAAASAGSSNKMVSPFASGVSSCSAAMWPHELQYLSAVGTPLQHLATQPLRAVSAPILSSALSAGAAAHVLLAAAAAAELKAGAGGGGAGGNAGGGAQFRLPAPRPLAAGELRGEGSGNSAPGGDWQALHRNYSAPGGAAPGQRPLMHAPHAPQLQAAPPLDVQMGLGPPQGALQHGAPVQRQPSLHAGSHPQVPVQRQPSGQAPPPPAQQQQQQQQQQQGGAKAAAPPAPAKQPSRREQQRQRALAKQQAAAAAATPAAAAAPAPAAQARAAPAPAGDAAPGGAKGADGSESVTMSRAISCKAYLKRLNITQPMAEALLPEMRLATAPRAGSCAASQQSGGRHYELLFKSEVSLLDTDGRRWQLVYEGAVCNTQRHLRLTSGWRDFVRGHNIQIGDTVVFERRGDDRTTLFATIKRGE